MTEIFQVTKGDITLATYSAPSLANRFSAADLITTRRTRACEDDLVVTHSNVSKSCFEMIHQLSASSKTQFEYDFGLGAWILIRRNSSIEKTAQGAK
jgi:hypothetical protein